MKNPFLYALLVALRVKTYGYCDIHVRIGKQFIDRMNRTRTVEDIFADTLRLLRPFNIEIIDKKNHSDNIIYRVRWV